MQKLEFICGPCVLESEDLAMQIAGTLKEKLAPFESDIELIFKGSFDKGQSFQLRLFSRPGMEKGLQILEKVKNTYGLPTVTDIHLPEQANPVASVVDVVQIPAFLCRQTDLVVAASKACQEHGSRLNIKKGQFLAPADTKNIVEKVSPFLSKENLYLTERGTSFGYNNLVVDMSSFSIMKSFGVRVIHDATHCVQMPGGLGKSTGGKREQIEVLARAAVAAELMGSSWKLTQLQKKLFRMRQLVTNLIK